MKKLYFLVLLHLLRLPTLQAQQPDSLTLRLNSVFANVDKSQMPTSLLAEYGLSLAPLDYFNSQLTDSIATTPTRWRALYTTAATARVAGSDMRPYRSGYSRYFLRSAR